MAFKRSRKKSIIVGAIVAGLIIAAAIAFLCFLNNMFGSVKKDYEDKITEYKMQIYQNKRLVLVPNKDIKYDTLLAENMFKEVEISSSLPRDVYMSKEDYGKFNVIDLKAGIPVMKSMLVKEKVPNDLREQELNMFLLQSDLEKDQFVDVRIGFPNGEDYIVLSKKSVIKLDLKQNTVWLWLNEREILTIASAIVDAYLNKGTKLYVTKYVQPTTQKGSTITYPVKTEVLKIIQSDPNIVSRAGLELAEQIRGKLDERLSKLNSSFVSSVDAGVSQELSKMKESVQNQDTQTASTPAPTNTAPSSQDNKKLPEAINNESSNTNKTQESGKNGFFN